MKASSGLRWKLNSVLLETDLGAENILEQSQVTFMHPLLLTNVFHNEFFLFTSIRCTGIFRHTISSHFSMLINVRTSIPYNSATESTMIDSWSASTIGQCRQLSWVYVGSWIASLLLKKNNLNTNPIKDAEMKRCNLQTWVDAQTMD